MGNNPVPAKMAASGSSGPQHPFAALPSENYGILAPPVEIRYTPELDAIHLASEGFILLEQAATIICAVCPALRDMFLEVPFATSKSDAPAPWLASTYGKPESLIPHTGYWWTTTTRLVLYHTVFNILIAIFRDSGDNRHLLCQSLFSAFKAASSTAVGYMLYPPWEVSTCCICCGTVMCHKVLAGILCSSQAGLRKWWFKCTWFQVRFKWPHLAQLTHFFREFNSMLMLYLGVIDEIPKFREAHNQLKVKTGSWFPYSKAICHSDTSCCTNSIRKLAPAALHCSWETIPTMRNYRAGKPTTGGMPDSKLSEGV